MGLCLEYESELTSQRREMELASNLLIRMFALNFLFSALGHLSILCILKRWLLVDYVRQYWQYCYRDLVRHPHFFHSHHPLSPTHLHIQSSHQPITVLIWYLMAITNLLGPIQNYEHCLQQALHYCHQAWPTRQQRVPPISTHTPRYERLWPLI